MAPLISIALGVSIIGGVVVVVKRMIKRHRPTPEQIEQAEAADSPGEQLPTATTEMTQAVARDPDFEADAARMRQRQGS